MATTTKHLAEKGRDLPVEQPVTTPVSAPVIPKEAYTYEERPNGEIVAGSGTGLPEGTNLNTYESVLVNQQADKKGDEPEANSQQQNSQPDKSTVTNTQAYLNPWGREGFTVEEALKNPDASIQQVMEDNIRWANDNGQQFDISPYLGIMSRGQDITKSTQQNETDAKKAARQEKWERLGNFLSHLGNFVGAAAFGAPSQKLESGAELTARQKKLRDETLAQRNAYNKNYLENYWKERAERQNQQKIENEKRKLDQYDEQHRLRVRKQDWLEKYQQGILNDKEERRRIEEEYKSGLITQKEHDSAIREYDSFTRRMNAVNKAAGYTEEIIDDGNGNKKKVRKLNTTGGSSSGGNDYSKYKKKKKNDYSQYEVEQ